MIRTLFTACLLLALPAPLAAQDVMPDNLTERIEGARAAQETARVMGEVLAANAVAQRQYAGMAPGALAGGFRGAVSMPGDEPGVWLTTIVGQPGGANDAPLMALADYEIADGAVRSEMIYPSGEAQPLDGDLLAMARAQIVAPRAVIASPTASFCLDGEEMAAGANTSVTFLTVALPPGENAAFDTYVLNGPFEGASIPLGKHYRVHFDEFGQVGQPELVTDTCEVVAWDENDPDLASRVYVTEDGGGDWPNAVQVFVSAQLPMRMGVVTGDLLWPMAGGMIGAPVPAAEAGY
jgi:hypothetical protein